MRIRDLLSIAMIALMTFLTACSVPMTPTADTTVAPVVIEGYAHPELLIDSAWIKAHIGDPSVRLIDVSDDPKAYAAGHIPGAVHISVSVQMTNLNDSTKGQILTQDALSDLMSSIGVTPETTIVFYDNDNNLWAARAFWVMRYYQHADVRIFDGGIKTWKADGQALVTDAVVVAPSHYVAKNPDLNIRTTSDYVLDHLDDTNVEICDARSGAEYHGSDKRSLQGGHIPGAINVDWINAINPDGTFKSAQELYEIYTKAGFDPSKQIITYCQTGVRGAHTWFVLKELLGFPDVRTYDGSWEEYGNMPDVPVQS